jgi:hypothetical protein
VTMATKAKRKFLALNVGEVSLVDEPANETPIAVMKRKEQEDMSTPAAATNKNTPAADQPGTPSTPVNKDASGNESDIERVDVDVSDGNADILKRLTSAVEQLVEKSTGETETEKKGKPPFAEKAEAEKKAKVDALRKQLEKAGLDKKAIDKAISTAFGTSTKKDSEGEEDEDASVSKAEAAMDVLELLGETIAKAKKFTPKRMAELEAITTKLNGLLGDLKSGTGDESASLATGVQPSAPATGGAPVAKSKDGDDSKPLDELVAEAVTKALKPLQDELEAIKKTRTPSQVAPTGTDKGGNKDGSEVTTEKSFWSGVL